MRHTLYVVIMGGGKGTRFWPKSTAAQPKQFLALGGTTSLLEQTVKRMRACAPMRSILIVGSEQHYALTRRLLPSLPVRNILAEPCGRNTAPCLGLASAVIRRRDADAVIAAVPADHLIRNEKRFQTLIRAAAHVAQREPVFVTLGIPPAMPHTGYGYIQCGGRHAVIRGTAVYRVKRFVEKPPLARARQYVARGDYYWNSGMFVFSVRTMRDALRRYVPTVYDGMERVGRAIGTSQEQRVLRSVYRTLASISIDYGIMERAENVLLMKADIGWNDVGGWAALDDVHRHDAQGNVADAPLCAVDSGRNIVVADKKKLIALVGVNDLVIVDTPRALLVAAKQQTEHVKNVVAALERSGMKKYL